MINVDDFEFRPREKMLETEIEYERKRVHSARLEFCRQAFEGPSFLSEATILAILELLEDMLAREIE